MYFLAYCGDHQCSFKIVLQVTDWNLFKMASLLLSFIYKANFRAVFVYHKHDLYSKLSTLIYPKDDITVHWALWIL